MRFLWLFFAQMRERSEMRQVAARVKHPCFGVRVASVHKINRLHLENVACRGERLLFEKTVFKTFCGEKDDKYVKTPRKSAVLSVLHLSSTHFGMPDWIRTSGLQSRSYQADKSKSPAAQGLGWCCTNFCHFEEKPRKPYRTGLPRFFAAVVK